MSCPNKVCLYVLMGWECGKFDLVLEAPSARLSLTFLTFQNPIQIGFISYFGWAFILHFNGRCLNTYLSAAGSPWPLANWSSSGISFKYAATIWQICCIFGSDSQMFLCFLRFHVRNNWENLGLSAIIWHMIIVAWVIWAVPTAFSYIKWNLTIKVALFLFCGPMWLKLLNGLVFFLWFRCFKTWGKNLFGLG